MLAENRREPIAIIGIGCRFPGATNPEEFWRLLSEGREAVTHFPHSSSTRFDINEFYDPQGGTPGKIVTRRGGFLADIDSFDYSFFGISPREAAYIDPQIRLLLELAWETLEDAGELVDKIRSSMTGVFVGAFQNDYAYLQRQDLQKLTLYSTVDTGHNMLSGRISFALDLRGPSISIDTACSSSLVAVHLACQSIWSGESKQALAGGVNLILDPSEHICFSQAEQMLAPDGRCKAFAAEGNGFVRSEGAGLIFLKPLSQALADGNQIYAVVRGGAVSNDGQSNQLLLAPSQIGQETALRQAYQMAGFAPESIGYIEAHGTGTPVGDPVELAALNAVLGEARAATDICYLGSVKTNIGHTEGAAGIAGLIKAALSLKYRQIPASLHFQTPNHAIPWHNIPFKVVEQLMPWPEYNTPARAGVSSFGLSGTNAHLILEEPPRTPISTQANEHEAYLLPLSAKTETALMALASSWQEWLLEGEQSRFADLCATAALRRTHHEARLVVLGHNQADVASQLADFVRGEKQPTLSSGFVAHDHEGKVVFVFSGQGSQWLGMGRSLFEQEPVFRAAFMACEEAMQPYKDWSLVEQLCAEEANQLTEEIRSIQPLLFAVQVALTRLWQSWGITPDAVVGHSMGEVAAAHIAGILSLEDAARVICVRSMLLQRVSGQGAMAAVGLSFEEATNVIAEKGDLLSAAVSNSPGATVISGDPVALAELMATLKKQKIFCRLVKVDVASHSPQMDPLLADLEIALRGIKPQTGSISFYSTVTRGVFEGSACDEHYWMRNLRESVLFAPVIQDLLNSGYTQFLEISPHPLLTGSIQQCARAQHSKATSYASLHREQNERTSLLSTLASFYTTGFPIVWEQIFRHENRCVSLPSYPWQREYAWFSSSDKKSKSGEYGRLLVDGQAAHPLLQRYIHPLNGSRQMFWETDLDCQNFPYLSDHRVRENIILPATAYLEMACAVLQEAYGMQTPVLEQIQFEQAFFLSSDQSHQIQIVLSHRNQDTALIEFFSQPSPLNGEHAKGILHAQAVLQINKENFVHEEQKRDVDPGVVGERCSVEITKAEHYQTMERYGLHYGPSFQGVEQLWIGEGEVLGRVHLSASLTQDKKMYLLHPALMDACFQLSLGAILSTRNGESGETYIPIACQAFSLFAPLEEELWVYATQNEQDGLLVCDIQVLSSMGQLLASVEGLQIKRLESNEVRAQVARNQFYELAWEESPLLTSASRETQIVNLDAPWLIFADETGYAQELGVGLAQSGESAILISPGAIFQRLSAEHYLLPAADPAAFRELFRELDRREIEIRGIVHLWALDLFAGEEQTAEKILWDQQYLCGSVLHLIQAIDERKSVPLFLVTRGAQAVLDGQLVSGVQATLWGLGRVLCNEHPELNCTLIDLSPDKDEREVEHLCCELEYQQGHEQIEQIALRGIHRYLARLAVVSLEPVVMPLPENLLTVADTETQFSLVVETPGVLESMKIKPSERALPGDGEVEIQVEAMGLNFKDTLQAMDVRIGPDIWGGDYAGRVSRVGSGVTDFQVGDEVMVIATRGFHRFIIAPAGQVVHKPAWLSFAEAASIPTVFLTASYALHRMGRIQKGERVLIHSACGGVGLAAIEIARSKGAEIFATVSTEEKRAYLRAMGVQHVMDSRTLAYVEEVRAATDGYGVDLVLNSLTGESLRRSIETLAPSGRFLEIGKRDIYEDNQIGLSLLKNNISFSVIALDGLLANSTLPVQKMLQDILDQMEMGNIKLSPITSFSVNEATKAFRTLAQGKHIGKIVLTMSDQPIQISAPPTEPELFKADATYLLTGGLGGIGLAMAEWMVTQGARHLVLLGRKKPSEEAQKLVESLRKQGAEILVSQTDITRLDALKNLFAVMEKELPPLRGIMHAATVLDDAPILELDHERFLNVIAPKVLGAWHLHQLTLHRELDFFVCFSSVASLLGFPGQSNYSAANAFLDSFVSERRAKGLPAMSINWGGWAEVGLAAAQANRGERLATRGLGSFTIETGLQALALLLMQGHPQLAFMDFNLSQWQEYYPVARQMGLFASLRQVEPLPVQNPDEQRRFEQRLHSGTESERLLAAEEYVGDCIARILGFGHTNIDRHTTLERLGFDSLMTLEIRNTIARDLDILLPMREFFQKKQSLQDIARHLGELLAMKTTSLIPQI